MGKYSLYPMMGKIQAILLHDRKGMDTITSFYGWICCGVVCYPIILYSRKNKIDHFILWLDLLWSSLLSNYSL